MMLNILQCAGRPPALSSPKCHRHEDCKSRCVETLALLSPNPTTAPPAILPSADPEYTLNSSHCSNHRSPPPQTSHLLFSLLPAPSYLGTAAKAVLLKFKRAPATLLRILHVRSRLHARTGKNMRGQGPLSL